MQRVVIGMSGGVDSSLAAALLKEQGHEVIGITLKLWPCAELDGGFTREDACCSPTETIDARSVARSRQIPHYVVDLEDEFRRDVVEGFVASYAEGETPNPCVHCNETIKFGHLWEHARDLGAAAVATGHYAQVRSIGGRLYPAVAVDRSKDQTYFLFSLTQEQLRAARFPVGEMSKEQVRDQARQRGLVTADKIESMDICFIGHEGVAGFLRKHAPQAFKPGDIVHAISGQVLGQHEGLAAYTIGQRRGLGVGHSQALYETELDLATNRLLVGERSDLMVSEAKLRDCTWHAGELPPEGIECCVRPRYHSKPALARIVPMDVPSRTGDKPGARVIFAQPQPRPSPGQACVAYDIADRICLGGGWFVR